MAPFLKRQKNVIETLYLSMNRLGDEGALAVAKALNGSETLLRLELGSNLLTDCGEALVDEVLTMKQLLHLGLGMVLLLSFL